MQQRRLDIDHLLRVAATEFAQRGFEGMSLRHLAEKCSVSQPAIYYHFSSKEALYEEVCSRRFDEIAAHVSQRVASAPARERLIAFTGALYDEWHRDETLLLLTQREVMNARADSRQCVAGGHYAFLMGLIPDLLEKYLGHTIDEDFAFIFGSLLFGYCSLMSFDRLTSETCRADYIARRKAALLAHVGRMWGPPPG